MRTVDSLPWEPWAYIDDMGQPVDRELVPALFKGVVVPTRDAILLAIRGSIAPDDPV